MLRNLTTGMRNNVQADSTRDIFLVRWEHAGVLELLSSNGRVVYDSEVYLEGEIYEPKISNNGSATISMPFSATRNSQVNNNTWRDGICQIIVIHASPDHVGAFAAEEGYLRLDGFIDTSSSDGNQITAVALHKSWKQRFTPRYTFSEVLGLMPPPGSTFTHEGESVELLSGEINPRDRGDLNDGSNRLRGSLTVSEANDFKQLPAEYALNVSAANAPMGIPFGPFAVAGKIGPSGYDGDELVVVVFWFAGEIRQFRQLYVDGAPLTNKMKVRHYRGTSWQGVDDWIQDIIPGFDSDLGLLKPDGKVAPAYSVFRLDIGAVNGVPKFQAVGDGWMVPDPDNTNNGDPLFDEVGVSVHFTGIDGATTATDDSSHSHAIVFGGDAQILNNQVEFAGAGSVTIADHLSLRPGVGLSFSHEIRGTLDTVVGTQVIYFRSGITLAMSVLILAEGSDLEVYLSSTGASNDIMTGVAKAGAFTAGEEFDIKLERDVIDGVYQVWFNGEHARRKNSDLDLFENGLDHVYGSSMDGRIRGLRDTIDGLRYGGVHTVDASPFTDSASFRPGWVYSDNPALCFAALAESPLHGGDMPTYGLSEASAFDDELIGGIEKRARLSLHIQQPRPTRQYYDLIASYGEFFWFEEGDGARVLPNQIIGPYNPSGQSKSPNPYFETDSDYFKDPGWTISEALELAVCDGTQTVESSLSTFVLDLDIGDLHAIILDIDERTAGEVRAAINGATVIPAKDAAGRYAIEYIPTDAAVILQAIASDDFVGNINVLDIQRYYWLDESPADNSVRMEGLSNNDQPSRLLLHYRDIVDGSPDWPDADPAIAELPGVDTGAVPIVESSLYMRGVYRLSEASNKVSSMLLRMVDRVRVTWPMYADGAIFQRGSVIHKRDPLSGLDMLLRVMDINTPRGGENLIDAEVYDPAHHQSDLTLPEGEGLVMEGLIGLLSNNQLPADWEVVNAADGKFIVCAGEGAGDPALAETGGSATYAGFAFDTEYGGGHHATTEEGFQTESYQNNAGSGDGHWYSNDNTEKGRHRHAGNSGVIDPDLYRRESILVRKINGATATLPANVMVFGDADVNIPNLVRSTAFQGRLLQAANANANAGVSSKFVELTTTVVDDEHDHYDRTFINNGAPTGINFTDPYYDIGLGGGPHPHDATLELERRIKKIALGLFSATDDYKLKQGVYMLWDQPLANITDPDWIPCDGLLGTPDTPGYHIEISAVGNEGNRSGDNRIRLHGETDESAGHSHESNRTTSLTHATVTVFHKNKLKHKHLIEVEDDWEPPYHAMFLLKHCPNPVPGFEDIGLLISGGEADGSTTIVDNSTYNEAATVTGSVEYDTAQLLFGVSTLLFATGSRLHYPGFLFGRKFTLEGFFRFDAINKDHYLFGNAGSGANVWDVQMRSNNEITLRTEDTDVRTVAGPAANDWIYVALCFDGTDLRLYYGLVSSGTASRVGDPYEHDTLSSEANLYIGNNSAVAIPFTGHSSELRHTRGASLFSEPTIPIPPAAFPTA